MVESGTVTSYPTPLTSTDQALKVFLAEDA
jgi:hypothetical protein